MKNVFLILVSLLLFVGCVEIKVLGYQSDVTCGDLQAMNYELSSWGEHQDITDECVYCDDLYDTEEEKYENCCCAIDASNWSGDSDCYSNYSDYCIFDE